MAHRAASSITFVGVLIVAMATVVSGCASKGKPPSTSPATTSVVSSSPTSTSPERSTPGGTPEHDIWSADLDELNEYVQREGLLGDVYFEYDLDDLVEEARDRLAKNAQFLRDHPELVVRVEGHCDERGTAAYNLALGDRRAWSATSYMTSLGASPEQLNRISYGKERPSCADDNEQCWSKNRRARFVISGRNPRST